MNRTKSIIFAILAFIICVIYFSCSKDCPTCPEPCPDPEPEPISDYDFYMFNHINNSNFLVYNTKEKKITNSISRPVYLRDVAVSANGSQFMYTTHIAFQADSMWVYNLPDMDLDRIVETYGYLEVSNTGKYIAVMDDTLTFLDANTYQVLFIDTGYFLSGRFLMDDSKFYTINDHTNKINVYDMTGESLYTEIAFVEEHAGYEYHPLLEEVQPVGNGERIYILAGFGLHYKYFLASYYPENDSIGFRYELSSIYGEMGLTPDESQFIFTDPWNDLEHTGSGNIIFTDVASDRPSFALSAFYSITGEEFPGFDPHKFAITPDSRYMLITAAGTPGGVFALIDIMNHEYADISINNSDTVLVSGVWCQKFLK